MANAHWLKVVLSVFLTACLVGACASGGGLATSPYYRPDGGERLYQYGNFCGPGYPVAEGAPTQESISLVLATQPVDYIDMACKAHDLCYLRYGVNRECDMILIGLMEEGRGRYVAAHRTACEHLGAEIKSAVFARIFAHSSLRLAIPVVAPFVALNAASSAGRRVIDRTSNAELWPEPGQCTATLSERTRIGYFAAQARRGSEGRGGYQYHRLYENTFNLDTFLATGTW